jgi:hypothetical protein
MILPSVTVPQLRQLTGGVTRPREGRAACAGASVPPTDFPLGCYRDRSGSSNPRRGSATKRQSDRWAGDCWRSIDPAVWQVARLLGGYHPVRVMAIWCASRRLTANAGYQSEREADMAIKIKRSPAVAAAIVLVSEMCAFFFAPAASAFCQTGPSPAGPGVQRRRRW